MLRLLLVALPLVVALPAFDKQELNALQFEVQSPLRLEVRPPPKSRPLRPAATHTPLRPHARTPNPPSAHITMTRRGTLERGQDDPPHDLRRHQPLHRPGIPTHHPQVCPPTRPSVTHAAQLRSALPPRARGRFTCCTRTRTRPRARDVRSRACPTPWTLRPPPGATQLALAIGTCERARRLACFADGLRVASPVQAAADACGQARRPPRPRHLRHDRQARHRHHGHEDPAAGTPAGSAAWRRETCTCEACACEPGAGVLEGAAPSAHCSTRSLTVKSGPVDSVLVIGADRHSKHHRGLHNGAASHHGSTTSPPLARRQPTHSAV